MDFGTRFLLEGFAAYIITCVVASSSLFGPLRERVKRATPWLVIGESKHPIECRLCLGFWVSLLVCLCTSPPELITINVLPVYGASYFLATQER
jgi:hypothetical protein